jgi:hypothetical protein
MINKWKRSLNEGKGSLEIEVDNDLIHLTVDIIAHTMFGSLEIEVDNDLIHLNVDIIAHTMFGI